jgi:hypothetical protein
VQGEGRQIALFVEDLVAHGDRKNAVQIAFAIGRLIAMALGVPGKDANLIVVPR